MGIAQVEIAPHQLFQHIALMGQGPGSTTQVMLRSLAMPAHYGDAGQFVLQACHRRSQWIGFTLSPQGPDKADHGKQYATNRQQQPKLLGIGFTDAQG